MLVVHWIYYPDVLSCVSLVRQDKKCPPAPTPCLGSRARFPAASENFSMDSSMRVDSSMAGTEKFSVPAIEESTRRRTCVSDTSRVLRTCSWCLFFTTPQTPAPNSSAARSCEDITNRFRTVHPEVLEFLPIMNNDWGKLFAKGCSEYEMGDE